MEGLECVFIHRVFWNTVVSNSINKLRMFKNQHVRTPRPPGQEASEDGPREPGDTEVRPAGVGPSRFPQTHRSPEDADRQRSATAPAGPTPQSDRPQSRRA